MCVLSYLYLCACVSVLKEETVQHKDSPAKRALCVSYDCCLIPPAATVTAVSSWRRDIAPLSLLLLLSSAFDLPHSSPFSVVSSGCFLLYSFVHLELCRHCRCVCVCVCARDTDQVAVHCFGAGDNFKCQPAFLVFPIVIYYTLVKA